MTTETLIERLSELGLDKYDPKRKAARAKEREEKRNKESKGSSDTKMRANVEGEIEAGTEPATSAAEVKRSRYIPAAERHAVETTTCVHVDSKTGRRCNSTRFLQLDHIHPFSQGGANTAKNLRWMCGAHNRWRAH